VVAFDEACPATIPANHTALEAHVGEGVVMVGFGVTTEEAEDAGIKRSGTATLFSVDPAEVNGLDAGELATSNDPDGTCNGDSGGPTFMTFGGVEVVVGTTSRGSLDAQGDEYPCGQGRSIAVRVDTYADFIDDFIREHDPDAVDPGGDPGEDPDPGPDPDPGADPDPDPDGDSGGAGPSAGCGCRAGSDRAPAGWPLFGLAALLACRWGARRRRS